MSANEHTTAWELLPAYALGALEAAEAADVARHVAGCPECDAELGAFEHVADALALAAPEAAPSAGLRGRLLAAAAAELRTTNDERRTTNNELAAPRPLRVNKRASMRQQRPSAVSGPPNGNRSSFVVRRSSLAFAVITLAAIILGGLLWAAVGRLTIEEEVVILAPSEAAPDAEGKLRLSGNRARLEVAGLPVLSPEQQYQLWVVRDDQRASGAVFSVNENGWAEVAVALEHPAAEYDRFGITVEPAGGSPGPTGERVLGWRRE